MSDGPERMDKHRLLKNAVLEVKEMRQRLETLERARAEPIAVIGMSCRFPGGPSPEDYWQLLRAGRDAVTTVPADRWDVDAWYDPDPDAPGAMYMRSAGFVDHAFDFDALFFNIAPREAVKMDPQHRLLLEVTWEALERAGQAPGRLAGSKTGVFVGIPGSDYVSLLMREHVEIDAYATTGNPHSMASGRLSYTLGLQGPSLSVDTACSSSLVAVHLAIQSLRAGECAMAVAGGVNLILIPETNVGLCKLRALATDGRSKSFDESADGYGRGEGCGMVVLKRLSDAVAHRDNILALILGSAVNQDGPSSGLTVPNGLAQRALLREALDNARRQPSDVGYIETHGTGTPLGDPIEAQAFGEVLGKGRPKDAPLYVGSAKANIGHLEGAAGVAGLIKAIHCLGHGEIPPHPTLKKLNSRIDLESVPAVIPTTLVPWDSARRIAGVSSFGFSGTNAHVLLGSAPPEGEPTHAPPIDPPCHLLTLSAKSHEALKALASRHAAHLVAHPGLPLGDVCFTANTGRAHFAHRLSLVATSTADAAAKLAPFASGEASELCSGKITGKASPKVAFLFTGQGSQYAGMGRQLFDTQPVFRSALERCDASLRPLLRRPLLSVLYPEPGEEGVIDETAYAQPAIFSLEFALSELWRSWGIKPSAVLGHSVGEYVAAVIAGVFSLDDGLKLIAERGRLMQSLPSDGEMVALFTDEQTAAAAIAPHAATVSLAAINGPAETVISGERRAILAIVEALAIQGVQYRPLTVSHPFHSPLMQPMVRDFERVLREVRFSPPRIPFASNVSGTLLKGAEPAEAAYWARHVLSPVRFSAGIQALREQRYDTFIELGPKPVLAQMAARCLPAGAGHFFSSLRKGTHDWHHLLDNLGALHVRGVEIDWAGVYRDTPYRRRPLPTYPWERVRYDVRADRPALPRGRAPAPTTRGAHALLGQRLESPALREVVFESRVSARTLPFLEDTGRLAHIGVYKEMLVSAAAQLFGTASCVSDDMTFEQGLVAPEEDALTLQLVLTPGDGDGYGYGFFSRAAAPGSPWIRHATGRLSPLPETGEPARVDRGAVEARSHAQLSGQDFYGSRMAERGLLMGPTVAMVDHVWLANPGEALGRIRAHRPEEHAEGYTLAVHPGCVDSIFQIVHAILPPEVPANVPFMLTGYRSFRFYGRSGVELYCHATRKLGHDADHLTMDLRVFDETGRVIADVVDASARSLNREWLMRLVQHTAPEAEQQGGLSLAELEAVAPTDRRLLLEGYLVRKLGRILGIDTTTLEPDRPLAGMIDSLMVVELAGRIRTDLGLTIPPADLYRDDLSASSLATLLLDRLPLPQPVAPKES